MSQIRMTDVAALGALVLMGAAATLAQGPQKPRQREWGPSVSIDVGGRLNVNTDALEGCPAESPDGEALFFASNRVGGKGLIDIWVADNKAPEVAWGDVGNLPEPVNSVFSDFCPTPLPGGRLLFVSNRPSMCGGGTDIYETRLHPVRGWLEPRNLGCQVNSSADEFSPAVYEYEGETVLMFSSARNGPHDIFITRLRADGTWTPAEAIAELNSPADDARPNVRKDGLEIFFDSAREGGAPDIWTAVRPDVFSKWSAPVRLGPNVNTSNPETRPWLSRDGTRLYFGSVRPGGQGNSDIFVSIRSTGGRRAAEATEPDPDFR